MYLFINYKAWWDFKCLLIKIYKDLTFYAIDSIHNYNPYIMRFGAYGIYDTIYNLTSFCIHSTPHMHSCMSPLIFLLRCLFKAVSLDKYAFLRISPHSTSQDPSTMFLNASLMPHVCISKNPACCLANSCFDQTSQIKLVHKNT